MRKWKKGKVSGEEFCRIRKDHRKWCGEERRRHEEEEEEKIKVIRTEQEAWKYINKYRKKREKIDEEIDLEKWKNHFMELLGGTMRRAELRWEEEMSKEGKEEETEDITKEEVIRNIKKLKMTKAPGEDGKRSLQIYVERNGRGVHEINRKHMEEGRHTRRLEYRNN